MDWLSSFNGWGFGSIVVVSGMVIAVVAMLRNKRIRSPVFQLGEDGKPVKNENGELVLAKTAMNEDDARRLGRIIREEISHECIQGDLLRAIVPTMEPVCQTTVALADRAIAEGANGLIKSGKERIETALEGFREVQASRLVG